ncbi:MAG: VWA domain-containing protein [Desulfuromusa sp.]|nr:VWA domain-containing protein [Desulfuromusa sp.]
MRFVFLCWVLLPLLFTGCSSDPNGGTYSRGIYLLIDTSGTYTQELKKAQQIINYTLAKLNSGDTLVVASIDTASFSEKDIISKVTFDDRPSKANQQKRLFNEKIDQYVKQVKSSPYTDITGGVLQATEFLNERNSRHKTILIFSDLKEELKEGYVRDIPLTLQGFEVVALNVTKLRSDNIDPREYMDRLEKWRSRVEGGGGHWKVINDLERLDKLIQ